MDHTPERLKLECCLWTQVGVRALILREYGKDMPTRTVREYLKRWASRCNGRETGDEAEYPAIHAPEQHQGAEIFWSDEDDVWYGRMTRGAMRREDKRQRCGFRRRRCTST